MKKLSLTILMSVVSTLVMAFTRFSKKVIEKPIDLEPSRPMALFNSSLKTDLVEVTRIPVKDHTNFLEQLGHYESSNRYDVVNRLGYMGKYQFSKATLKAVGIDTTQKEFLSDPYLQEEAMDRLLTENYKSLKRYIKKYNGKKVHGVLVTKSGILAAAHLGGAGNVRNWFRKGENFSDANGTKITKYMILFNGYQLDL